MYSTVGHWLFSVYNSIFISLVSHLNNLLAICCLSFSEINLWYRWSSRSTKWNFRELFLSDNINSKTTNGLSYCEWRLFTTGYEIFVSISTIWNPRIKHWTSFLFSLNHSNWPGSETVLDSYSFNPSLSSSLPISTVVTEFHTQTQSPLLTPYPFLSPFRSFVDQGTLGPLYITVISIISIMTFDNVFG